MSTSRVYGHDTFDFLPDWLVQSVLDALVHGSFHEDIFDLT